MAKAFSVKRGRGRPKVNIKVRSLNKFIIPKGFKFYKFDTKKKQLLFKRKNGI